MIETDDSTMRHGRPIGLQVGLRHLLLVTFCAGVWFAYWTNRVEIARLEPKLVDLQKLSPELRVVDPNRIAIVQLSSPWISIMRWDVYIPTDTVRICIATEGIDHFGVPDNYLSVPLPKGRYEIQLDEQQDANSIRYLVTQNGRSCIDIEKGLTDGNFGSSMSTRVSSQSQQFDGNVPCELIRRRFNVPVPGSPGSSRTPAEPSQGVLLWIQSDVVNHN